MNANGEGKCNNNYHRLLLGFMIATMLLSMWISNTATTTMMIPIVEAVLQQLKRHMVTTETGNHGNTDVLSPAPALTVCYSSLIATLYQ